MQLRVLGTVTVLDDDARTVPLSDRQHALVALICAGGGWLSTGRLIEALWPDEVLGVPANTLQRLVSRVRQQIGASRLVAERNGYRLRFETADVDSWSLSAWVDAAPVSIEGWREFITAWRGDPYLGVYPAICDDPMLLADAQRLQRRYSDGLTRLAMVGDGGHLGVPGGPDAADLIGPLELALSFDPSDERVAAALASSLIRTGRPARAVSVIAELRELLAERGLVPGQRLRAIEEWALQPERPAPTGGRPHPSPGYGHPLVERHRLAALAAERSATHRCVVLAGASGTGKSTAARQICSNTDSTTIRFDLADEPLAALARSLPAIRSLLDRAGEVHGLELRLGEALAAGSTSTGRLILDDLQFADRTTLDVVEAMLAADGEARVLATWNTDHSEMTTGLRRLVAAGAALVPVGPFAPEELDELARLAEWPGGVDDLRAIAGAQPFLTGLVLRHRGLSSGNSSGIEHEAATLLDALVDRAVGHRPILDLLATAGPVPLDVLATASGLSVMDALSGVDRLAAAHLVSEFEDRWGLAHEIIRTHLLATMSQGSRGRRAVALATGFEQHPIHAAEAPTTVASLWLAGPESTRPRAASHLDRALRRAIANGAWSDADTYVELLDSLPSATCGHLADLARGRVQMARGDQAAADRSFRRVIAEARRSGDDSAIAEALHGLAGPVSSSASDIDLARTLVAAAQAAELDRSPSVRVRLLVRAIGVDLGRSPEAAAWSAAAQRAAEESDDPVDRAAATHGRVLCALGTPSAVSRRVLAEPALRTDMSNAPDVEVALLLDTACASFELGDWDAACRAAESLDRLSRRTAQPIISWWAAVVGATTEQVIGSMPAALDKANSAAELGVRLGLVDARPVRALHRVAVLHARDHLDVLAPRYAEVAPSMAPITLAIGAAAQCNSSPDLARTFLDVLGSMAAVRRNYLWHATASLAITAAIRIDHPLARETGLITEFGPHAVVGSCFGVLIDAGRAC